MKLRKQIANRLQLAIKQDIMKKKEEAIKLDPVTGAICERELEYF